MTMTAIDADEDRMDEWADIPPEVRARIGPALPPGHSVWACMSMARGGTHTEWSWIDERGELLDAFWLE